MFESKRIQKPKPISDYEGSLKDLHFAKLHLANKNYSEALAFSKSALEKNPYCYDAYGIVGISAFHLGSFEIAYHPLSKAHKVDKSNCYFIYLFGLVQRELKDIGNAVKTLTIARDCAYSQKNSETNTALISLELANTLMLLEKFKEALQEYDNCFSEFHLLSSHERTIATEKKLKCLFKLQLHAESLNLIHNSNVKTIFSTETQIIVSSTFLSNNLFDEALEHAKFAFLIDSADEKARQNLDLVTQKHNENLYLQELIKLTKEKYDGFDFNAFYKNLIKDINNNNFHNALKEILKILKDYDLIDRKVDVDLFFYYSTCLHLLGSTKEALSILEYAFSNGLKPSRKARVLEIELLQKNNTYPTWRRVYFSAFTSKQWQIQAKENQTFLSKINESRKRKKGERLIDVFNCYIIDLEQRELLLDPYSESNLIEPYRVLLLKKHHVNQKEISSIANKIFKESKKIVKDGKADSLQRVFSSFYENKDNKIVLKKYLLNDFLFNGKHSNKRLIDVLLTDPQYLLWCIKNLGHFCIDPQCYLSTNLRNLQEFSFALKLNEIKLSILSLQHDEYNILYASDTLDEQHPQCYGYRTWSEMSFYEAFEGDNDAWNEFNQ